MAEYKYELHVHTSEGSRDSRMSGSDMVKHYRSLGYAGVCITDHFTGSITRPLNAPWKEQMDVFCSGYEAAAKAAEGTDFQVFFGLEYSYLGTDFLTYGLSREWLKAHPRLLELSVRDYLSLVRESGALAVQAHPYREADYIDHIRLYPSDVDGIETVNAGRTQRCNRLGEILAQEYGLLKTGGSDLHVSRQKMLAGIETEFPLACIADFIAAVKKGEAKPFAVQNIF